MTGPTGCLHSSSSRYDVSPPTAIALFISFIINLFVVCVFGAVSETLCVCVFTRMVMALPSPLPPQGVYAYSYSDATQQKQCTEDISLLNAADCLYYRYNHEWVKYIWAIGLLAAGQSSTMTVSQRRSDS